MADDAKEEEGASSRGADWEVLSLTASAYAAAPSPKEFDSTYEGEDKDNNRESSGSMFMSEHFVFPPSEHENLPIEPDYSEIHSEPEIQDVHDGEDSEVHRTDEDKLRIKSDDDLCGIQFVDNESSLSVRHMDLEEEKGLYGLNLAGKEQSMYASPRYGAFDAAHTESGDTTEPDHPSQEYLGSPQKFPKPEENDKGSSIPHEAWWKRHAACLYRHVKETNTFWSVFVAAALMGLVILGRRWQREKLQLQQLKWHINDECLFQVAFSRAATGSKRSSRMVGQIGRFKDVLAGGHHRTPLIHGGAASGSH